MINNFECGGYKFNANFDSGNLDRVEFVAKHTDEVITDNNLHSKNGPSINVEFNLWTRPDCAGTPYENTNRTWFFFGVKGGRPSHIVKFNIMNLNRQAKLYSQGMHPVIRIGASGKWERIKDGPTYSIERDNFVVSFVHRGGEDTSVEFYYAFTFPYTYHELQDHLTRLDRKYRKKMVEVKKRSTEDNVNLFVDRVDCEEVVMDGSSSAEGTAGPDTASILSSSSSSLSSTCTTGEDLYNEIYYYRELLTQSVEGRRIDLITITSYHGIQETREERLPGLFPDKLRRRSHSFADKKFIFVSSRVHPGETPASFVLNGFMRLLLDKKSVIAATLRKLYVFKIVPFLNPDGVHNGAYRSDTLGHNLNRMYTNPDADRHPSIYAVRKLLRYYHNGCDKPEACEAANAIESPLTCMPVVEAEQHKKFDVISLKELIMNHLNKTRAVPEQSTDEIRKLYITSLLSKTDDLAIDLTDSRSESGDTTCKSTSRSSPEKIPETGSKLKVAVEAMPKARKALGKVSKNEIIKPAVAVKKPFVAKKEFKSRQSGTEPPAVLSARYRAADADDRTSKFQDMAANVDGQDVFGRLEGDVAGGSMKKTEDKSNLFLYIDLHGHASKKGVFMYGNHMAHPMQAVECMLLPRLMSMNSHHFHFDACNFSERNMYHKGKRDGLSKEGSGRVAVYKSTGLIKSYTLECNYNTGKCVNVLPPRGKETTSKAVNLVPPKYTPTVFEEVGRALGPSILDLTNTNPISRVPNSEFRTMQGLRNALRTEIEKSFNRSQLLLKAAETSNNTTNKARLKRLKCVVSMATSVAAASTDMSKENKLGFWDNNVTSVSAGSASQCPAETLLPSTGKSGMPPSNSMASTKRLLGKFVQNIMASSTNTATTSSSSSTSTSTIYGKKEAVGRKKPKTLCDSNIKMAELKKESGTGMVPVKRFKVTPTGSSALYSKAAVDSDDTLPSSDEDRLLLARNNASDESAKGKRPSGIPIFKRMTKNVTSVTNATTTNHYLMHQPSTSKSPLLPIKRTTGGKGSTGIGGGVREQSCDLKKPGAEQGSTLPSSGVVALKMKKKRSLKSDPNIKRKKSRVKSVWH